MVVFCRWCAWWGLSHVRRRGGGSSPVRETYIGDLREEIDELLFAVVEPRAEGLKVFWMAKGVSKGSWSVIAGSVVGRGDLCLVRDNLEKVLVGVWSDWYVREGTFSYLP
jgi:hypothetical protein